MVQARNGLLGLACAGLMAWLASGLAAAESAPEPDGAVILTVAGAIAQPNGSTEAQFDLATLQAMETVEFQTSTIWTDGVQVFRGVPLVHLVEALGAKGEVIVASALNDYSVEIPFSDAVDGGPILAFAQNGEALSVRDKGPLWVVYPYDSMRDYQSEVIYARSIWQVKRMEFR